MIARVAVCRDADDHARREPNRRRTRDRRARATRRTTTRDALDAGGKRGRTDESRDGRRRDRARRTGGHDGQGGRWGDAGFREIARREGVGRCVRDPRVADEGRGARAVGAERKVWGDAVPRERVHELGGDDQRSMRGALASRVVRWGLCVENRDGGTRTRARGGERETGRETGRETRARDASAGNISSRARERARRG